MDKAQSIIHRWQKIRAAIDQVALDCNRDPEDIILVAVSKIHSAQAVQTLAQAGHLDFGENYVQEALDKQDQLLDIHPRWHFIGRLQSNKAKYLPGRFHLIHSLDRLKTAITLDQRCAQEHVVQPVLLQVNLAGEEQKGGVPEAELKSVLQDVGDLQNLNVQGLMCMPPFFDDQERARPFFRRLAHTRDRLEQELGTKLKHLSMGMSGDYPAAIEEGATLLRIGTSIFGARD
ncbi:MAG: YggS family pyridoxal phosphate-dependent enzyme [Desulfovermiculus sp.]|nr:YggS family pyridoxal phosphate-dependent enzyme [Desulfovermiculus sp.]